jgi:outer membrane protein assembly factor BamA
MKKLHLCVLLISIPLLSLSPAYLQAGGAEATVKKYVVGSIDFESGGIKRSFKDKKLLEKLDFETGDDIIMAEPGRDNLEKFYHEQGFFFAKIALKTGRPENEKIKLTYQIDEGPKVKVGRISFSGNDTLRSDELKKALKTPQKKWLFWSRNYTEEELTRDINKLKGIYWEKGFLAHKITYSLNPNILDPAVMAQERMRKKCKININFAIEEGPVYTVEKILLVFINTAGQISEEIVIKSKNPSDLQKRTEYKAFDEEQLREQVKLEPAQIYSERLAQADAKQLRKLYGENGFINADVRLPSPVFIPDVHAVNIEFEIFEGRQYRIGRIDITGNKETKEKVYRRILDEYDFFPGQLYNTAIAPKEGGGELERKIQRMTMAEEVTIAPMGQTFGPKDAKVLGQDVEVNIKEGLTGNIWPGVGVSSDHGIMGQLIYDERNFDITDWPEDVSELIPGRSFRGAGQSFLIAAEPGTEFSRYSASFGDPYWGGEPNKPIHLGVTGSSWERDRDFYDEGRIKGYISFKRRTNKGRWRRSISFRAVEVEIDRIDPDPPIEIIDVEGKNFIAGIKLGIEHNTTDDENIPTKGSIFDINYEQVGGDHSFGLLQGTQRWYITLGEDLAERKTVLAAKLLGATTIDEAPPFEKYYGGGTSTYGIRGFDYRGVSTRSGIHKDPIGSDWIFLANAEVIVPLTGDSFAALFFVDSGTIDSGGYRAAVGTGIQILIPQWFGPVPMRFELGVPIMKDDDDDRQVFSFSVGSLF